MTLKTLLQPFMFSVRAAAFRRAVAPATAAKNALVAHAAYQHTPDPSAPRSYPAAVQALLDAHDAETNAVTQLFFGPSRFSRLVDRATSNTSTAEVEVEVSLLDQVQT